MRLALDDPKQWSPRRLLAKFLEDRRISAKSIAEQLDISSKRVRSIIHEDLDIRKLSAKWVPKCLNLIINLRDGHCFGSSRTRRITGGKITMFKLGHPVFVVAYDGACSPNVSVRMAWIFFDALPCRKILMTSRVSMFLKSRAPPDMLPFSLCNKKSLAIRHKNRPLFPTTLSIPSYDIGK